MSMLKINEEDIYEGIDDVTVPTWPLCDTLYILPYFNDQVLSLNLRRDALFRGHPCRVDPGSCSIEIWGVRRFRAVQELYPAFHASSVAVSRIGPRATRAAVGQPSIRFLWGRGPTTVTTYPEYQSRDTQSEILRAT